MRELYGRKVMILWWMNSSCQMQGICLQGWSNGIGRLRGELKYGQSFLDSRTIGLLVHYISLPREEFMNLYRQGSQHPDGDLLLGIYHYLKYLENKH